MRFFKKKKDVIDLGDLYKKRQQKISDIKSDFAEERNSQIKKETSRSFSPLGFFGAIAETSKNNSENSEINENSTSENYVNINTDSDSIVEKRKRLAKRLSNMTEKIEELSNSIYHLQQRLDVIERKLGLGVGGYD
ncbi:hypothetical protein K9L16_00950 [Candidatus Pacearchaeota archaeon]|nr:hypothetical protein [Candidatus Pacearchaeota archaeon]